MTIKKLSPEIWILLYVSVTLSKAVFLFFGGGADFFDFGGGNDADYYEASALHQGEAAVNIWSVLLSFLVDLGFFSRQGVASVLMFVSSIIIPYLVVRVSLIGGKVLNNKRLWFTIFVIGVYPALFFFSLDIYRDVFMVLVYLAGLFAVKGLAKKNDLIYKLLWLTFGMAVGFMLVGLRVYLGAAYMLMLGFALLGDKLTAPLKNIGFMYLIFIYLSLVYIFHFLGLLDALMQYRSYFELGAGGSTFGLQFDSVILFIPNFVLSWAFQIFGLWPFTSLAIVLFFIESVPFIFCFFYVLGNRVHIATFGWCLIIFFIAYNTIWIIGNDNLGTAWRLRIFSYISIFVVFLQIYQEKIKLSRYPSR